VALLRKHALPAVFLREPIIKCTCSKAVSQVFFLPVNIKYADLQLKTWYNVTWRSGEGLTRTWFETVSHKHTSFLWANKIRYTIYGNRVRKFVPQSVCMFSMKHQRLNYLLDCPESWCGFSHQKSCSEGISVVKTGRVTFGTCWKT
jgi:hypothetical protein